MSVKSKWRFIPGDEMADANELIPVPIPRDWEIVKKTVQDLIDLGQDTIQEMIRIWRLEIRLIIKKLKFAQNDLDQAKEWSKKKNLSQKTVQLVSEMQKALDVVKEEKNKINRKIRKLSGMKELAEKKPSYPAFRSPKYFNKGEKVIYFLGMIRKAVKILVKQDFVSGTVVSRFHDDGMVIIRCDKQIHNVKHLRGYGINCGRDNIDFMHDWEFEYLLVHPEFAKIWSSDNQKFIKALAREAIARSKKK